MTNKKKVEKKKEPAKKKTSGEKRILYELVQEYPEENSVVLGALAKAGYLGQYRYEESVYKRKVIKPSITVDELNKIIQNFVGDIKND